MNAETFVLAYAWCNTWTCTCANMLTLAFISAYLCTSKQVHEAANQLVVEPDSDEEVTERSCSPVPPSMTLPQDGFAHSTQEAAISAAFTPSSHAQSSVELSGVLVDQGAQMVPRLQSPLQAAVERRIEAVQLRASPNDAGAPPLPVLLDQEIGDDIFLEAMGYTPSRPGAQPSWIVMVALIAAVQAVIETRKAMALRRLKYAKDGKWVECTPLGDPQGEDLEMLGPVAKARGRARGISSLLSLSMSLSCSVMPSQICLRHCDSP